MYDILNYIVNLKSEYKHNWVSPPCLNCRDLDFCTAQLLLLPGTIPGYFNIPAIWGAIWGVEGSRSWGPPNSSCDSRWPTAVIADSLKSLNLSICMMAYGHLVFPHISTWQKIIITWSCSKKYGVSLLFFLGVAEDQPSQQQKKHGFLIGKIKNISKLCCVYVGFQWIFCRLNHLLNLTFIAAPSSSHHHLYGYKVR